MITIITGKPGAGKTLFMTYTALEMFLKGFDIYANWKLDFSKYVEIKKINKEKLGKVFFWSEIPELLSIKGGQIFIDEAQGYFDSREWLEMPPSAKQKFSAHRHDIRKDDDGNIIPLDVWAGVQHMSNIDKRIRDLGQHFIEVRNIFRLFFMTSYFELHDLKDDTVKRQAVKRNFFMFNKLKANCYNTHEAVNFIEYEEFPYYREYKKEFSNDNTGLIPTSDDIPPYHKQQKRDRIR
ncbi:MAG: hypothetical protein UY92_C0006G0009 [Candidatus Magasanikbacteria bacterium GW2011_GWA2_56_11]|uniref:Zona occludens toxin N-terminal domain-containing protein n=1 Tax=Candidatus Magasanikbacteria bacterium GW2011_GWA2_56_11 TaxID=1619044 RepID=A0A0G1YG75_9BACT|nr:MAG: hypothetical protein UY92_C0006G0009 [Candidatus Magasanikbacteria bacterium GW2011_GWA2_56_11]